MLPMNRSPPGGYIKSPRYRVGSLRNITWQTQPCNLSLFAIMNCQIRGRDLLVFIEFDKREDAEKVRESNILPVTLREIFLGILNTECSR